MLKFVGSWSRRIAPLAFLVFFGCAGADSDRPEPVDPQSVALVPVSGTVTLDDQPLQGAVVTFLPDQGAASNGETDEQGKYSLETYGREGAPEGTYRVAVSYLVSSDGEPQGMVVRGAIIQPQSILTATERLLPEYSDLGRSKLSATVPAQGGTFDFQVEAVPVEAKQAPEDETPRDPSPESEDPA